ncbi:MAG TPA: DUF5985 family protein [Candidatus Acidoferrales bacterium]|nr:DUF5985 family protein [Candidatus Acidoferrales bacterium]
MSDFVYILSSVTSALCAVLLLRSYARARQRLLLWSGLAFVGFTLNNALLWVDIRALPNVDLSAWRLVPAVLGLMVLCYGLIWETT